MSENTDTQNPNCPWCGAEQKRVGFGLAKPLKSGIEWCCGSSKHGKEPWQDVSCELNVANKKIDLILHHVGIAYRSHKVGNMKELTKLHLEQALKVYNES